MHSRSKKGRGKTWGSFEAQSLPLAEGGRDGETEKGGRDPSLEPFLPVTYTVERSYALVGACTQAHKGASHECLIKEEGERGWRRRRGIHQGVTTPLPEQRRQIGTIAVECLSGERGPCKRAGVLILAKKKPPADSPWHHAPLPPSPSLPLLSHDYHLGPAEKGSKRQKPFFSAAKGPHSLSSGTCEIAALPPFPFLEDDALCSTRRTYLFGVQQMLPLSCIFLLYTPRSYPS